MLAPWIQYVEEVRELFNPDPNIEFEFDEPNLAINMRVKGVDRIEAIHKLLPTYKKFDKTTVTINLIPEDDDVDDDLTLLENAFSSNPLFNRTETAHMMKLSTFRYCVFNKDIIQYFADDLGDVHGNRTCFASDIAKDILNTDGVFYCVDDGRNEE